MLAEAASGLYAEGYHQSRLTDCLLRSPFLRLWPVWQDVNMRMGFGSGSGYCEACAGG
jgi:hypothetical protein